MSENDLNNLIFLLNASEEVLSDWYDSVSEDDHAYAQELLRLGTWEILDLHNETDIANDVLKKFRLNSRGEV